MGGHTEAILNANPGVTVIGIDRDSESLELSRSRLSSYGSRFRGIHANFKELESVLAQLDIRSVDGIVADLGVSSSQLESPDRGFSFSGDAPLDMRMDRSRGPTAADLLSRLEEREIADLIFRFGEERHARRIARAIVRDREGDPVFTTGRLAKVVARAVRARGRWRIHPATKTFQALRIAVNEETEGLAEFVQTAISSLNDGARLAVISFHSLEDRVIKQEFRRESGKCVCGSAPRGAVECRVCGAVNRVRILTPKPIRPSAVEVAANRRARSARLRVCERLGSSPVEAGSERIGKGRTAEEYRGRNR
jgi:16S rRNA (cytosine1402-N4)-methyltransferase